MSATLPAPVKERRFDGASWLTLAFVVGFAVACLVATVLVLVELGDGCLLDGRRDDSTIHACVGAWDTPLQPGDRVLSVAGLQPDNGGYSLAERESNRPLSMTAATTLPYTIDRGGEQVQVMAPLGRLDGQSVVRALGAGLVLYSGEFLIWIFVGSVIIFALAPRSRAAQLLLVASGAGALGTTVNFSSATIAGKLFLPAPLYIGNLLIGTFWQWLFVPTLLLLVLSFPRRVWPLARWPRATPILLYGLPLAAIVAELMTGQVMFSLATLGIGALAFLVAMIVVTAHTVWRVRDPVVRAQTFWLSLGLLVGVGIVPVLWLMTVLVPGFAEALDERPWAEPIFNVIIIGIFFACMSIAITRYHLFDIAIVINRALVYTLLTGALAAVYLGSVVLVQSIVRALTGQESDLAIVASTLVVAACFQPLRGRIQAFIDRRFFRRKYDAAQILAAHGAVVRDEVDIDRLTVTLVQAVNETVRPARASLWLRTPKERR